MTYRIKHDGVGPFTKGRVVSDEQLARIAGMDVDRLLNIGAIEVADAPVDETPVGPGPENPGNMMNKSDSDNAPDGTDDAADDDDDEDAQEDAGATDYSKMKKDELIAHAGDRGVEVTDEMTKAQIVEALQAADAAAE